MLLNNLRNKEQEHKDIKNILEKDYGYTIKSPVYGNSAKKVLQQVQDAKQELYRNFTVEEYNRVVLFEKYLQQLIELDANKWGKGNPNVGGAMALDPNWAGGLRGAGMGAEVTQGHASADEVKKWLGTSDGKIFVNRAKTHGDDVNGLLKDPELMGMAPAGLMSSIAVANGVRLGMVGLPALAAVPGAGWVALIAIGIATVGILAWQIHKGNKEKEAIEAEVAAQTEAVTTVTGEEQKDWSKAFFQPGEDPSDPTRGRTTDRTTGRGDPVMSRDSELDPNAGKRNEIFQNAVVDVSTELKLGDPKSLDDKKAHMAAADKINAIMGSMYRDLADIDPEGGADYDDPTTDARLIVSDPRSQFGVSQQGVKVPIDRTKAAGAIPQTGVSQKGVFTMPGAPGVEYDPEGEARFDDPTTDARLTVSDPRSQFGVSQANIAAGITAYKEAEAAAAAKQQGIEQGAGKKAMANATQAAIAASQALAAQQAQDASDTRIAIGKAGTDIKYDDQGMMAEPTGRADVDRSEWVTPDMKVADPAVLRAKQDYMDKGDAAAQRALAIAHNAQQRNDIKQGKAPPMSGATHYQQWDTGVHDAPEDDPRGDKVNTGTGVDHYVPGSTTGKDKAVGIAATPGIDGTSTGTDDVIDTGTIGITTAGAHKITGATRAQIQAQRLAQTKAQTQVNTNSRTRSGKKGGKKKPKGGVLPILGVPTISGTGAKDRPEPRGQTFGALGGYGVWPYGKLNSSTKRRGNVMNEEATFKNLKKLLEQDLDQAELALAAKDMVVQLQDIAEDLAKMQVENLMPLVDRIKEEYGPEAGEQFNGSVEAALGSALEGIKGTHEQVQDAVLVLTGDKPAMSTDMGSDDMSMDMGDTDMDDGLGGDDEISLDGADAAAGPADMSLGRAVKKESVEKAKRALQTALREGKYNDKVLRRIIQSMK